MCYQKSKAISYKANVTNFFNRELATRNCMYVCQRDTYMLSIWELRIDYME